MKTKLPSYAMQNFKSAAKSNGIFAFLIIFLMTISTFGQTIIIELDCLDVDGTTQIATLEFEEPVNGVYPGKAVFTGGSQSGYTLFYESSDDTWVVNHPDPYRFFYTTDVPSEPTPCSATWVVDKAAGGGANPCDSVVITCHEICDGIDNDGDGEIDEGLEGCTPPAIIQYCNEADTKVLICHNGNEICVSINAVDAHLAHYDTYGPCVSSIADNQEETTDIEDITKGDPTTIDVKYWPNPSNDVFNVKMITPNFEDEIDLQVFDLNGRLVHADVIGANKNYQFGNSLSNGIYFAKLTQAGTSKVLKVVKH